MKNFFYSPAIPFSVAIFLGFIFPHFSYFLEPYTMYILMLVMLFSTTSIKVKSLFSFKYCRGFLHILALNYVLLSSVILVFAFLFISEPLLLAGFVIMAAMPPAVAVIPFSHIFRGNVELSMFSNLYLHLLSIPLAPLFLFIFLGETGIPFHLLKILCLIMILPFLLSRILVRFRVDEKLGRKKDILINILFFFLIYSLIGPSRSAFFTEDILPICLINIVRTFIIGTAVFLIFRRIEKKERITYTLFSSYKNLGAGAVIALLLFGSAASVPLIVCIPFELGLVVYYSLLFRENNQKFNLKTSRLSKEEVQVRQT